MLPTEKPVLHTLTSRDVERIRGLLQSVEEAIAEIIAYRAVRPIDPGADLPMEDNVYRQTSGILEDTTGLRSTRSSDRAAVAIRERMPGRDHVADRRPTGISKVVNSSRSSTHRLDRCRHATCGGTQII
jgi:hypothetical protein